MEFSQEIHDFWEKAKNETGIEGAFTDAYGIGDTPSSNRSCLTWCSKERNAPPRLW